MSALKKRREGDSGTIRKKLEQGLRLQAQDRHAEAVSRFRKVLAAQPDDKAALTGLARSLIATGRSQEAVEMLDGVAAETENNEQPLYELAQVCLAIQHYRLAEKLYERVLTITPDAPVALVNLANLLDERGEAQRAADLLSRTLELDPNAADAYASLGRILANAAQFDDAMICYRRAIELKPNSPTVYTNFAAMLESIGRHDEALKICEQALLLKPDCDATRWNLARLLLATGHIEAGWDMYGFGFACGQRLPCRPFPGLIWEGEDLTGKTIMVWREQGIGDDVIFSTCYTDLIARAGHVIIETNPRLVSLYRRTWPEATVRAETATSTGLENYGDVDFDFTAPAGMAAALLRRNLDAFPAEPRFLVPDPARVAECRAWLDTLGSGPVIGLSWSSAVKTSLRSRLYTDLNDWKELFAIEGARIVNLQYTDVTEEAAALQRDFGMTLHRMPGLDLFNDIEGAAALSACMEAAVAPSSFPATLAAGLGVPCFHYTAPRAWTKLGTDRLPWFPTMRCYALDQTTDRSALIERIAVDVAAFVRG
ncbi:MAG: tetratricopeptide repeat protein [Parvibaculum sp.]|nr:tetratricopeptide repeat protein [Parvibaculum sp.]